MYLEGGTRIQKLNNITDSPELLFKKLSNYKDRDNKRNDPALLRAWCEASPGTLDWLEERGVRFMDILSPTGGKDALHRKVYHYLLVDKEGPGAASLKTPEGVTSGAGLVKPLESHARKKGVKIFLEHKMTRIIRDDGRTGRVLGVEAQQAGGKKVYFKAKKAVILGTGGWKGNKFFRKLFDPRMTDEYEGHWRALCQSGREWNSGGPGSRRRFGQRQGE